RFLAALRVISKSDSVHGEYRRGPAPREHPGGNGRKLLEFPDSLVHALDNVFRSRKLLKCFDNSGAPLRTVPRLREHLEREYLVVAVDDQPRDSIGFTENQAIGIRIADNLPPILQRIVQPLPQESDELILGAHDVSSNYAQLDLGSRAVDCRSQQLAFRINHMHERTSGGAAVIQHI